MAQIIVALDTKNLADAIKLINQLQSTVKWFKAGLELFTSAGPCIISEIKKRNLKVFLDLKFYDIPNTVAGAVEAACKLGVDMLTLHCQGGERMCREAMAASSKYSHPPRIIGVTVLTSFANGELPGIQLNADEFGLSLAAMAQQWGLNGIVCSGLEVAQIKNILPDLICVCPGIRLDASGSDDQRRIVTPAKAVQNGADFLVIGRPVTKSDNPERTAREILAELNNLSNIN